MARLVKEVMNDELFTLRPDCDSEQAVSEMLALGVTGAPVVDDEKRAVGFVSLRDLAGHSSGRVGEGMSKAVVTTHERAGLTEAALLAVRSGVHHLVVLNELHQVSGIVSVLDLLAGFVGYPAQHAPSFPHFDPATGLSWSECVPLALEFLPLAPDGPGVLTLIFGGQEKNEVLVWAEAAHNVRSRLYQMIAAPQADSYLNDLLSDVKHLRFRAAAVANHTVAGKAVAAIKPRPWRPEQFFLDY
jgi:hypothetical protein